MRGIAYLALGNVPTVQAELSAALRKRPPFGYLDAPASADVEIAPGNDLSVMGWVLDSAPITDVHVEIDDRPRPLPCAAPRGGRGRGRQRLCSRRAQAAHRALTARSFATAPTSATIEALPCRPRSADVSDEMVL